MIDWTDRSIPDEVHVMMVDPHNLDIVRGELENLILSDCSVFYGYNTDTRTSAKLATLGSNYIDNSWLRIIHKRGDFTEELGTYVLEKSPEHSWEKKAEKYSYQLQSVLWSISKDYATYHYSIGKGAYTLNIFDDICKIVKKINLHEAGARNYRYSASKVFEVGDSWLSFLFDICETANDRLDIDGHGRITISPYYSPTEITPSWDIDADSKRTMLLSDAITWSASNDAVPGRALVIYSNGDTEIIASSDQPSSSPYSDDQRGYTITNTYQISDMTPVTKARAQQLASQYLSQQKQIVQCQCSMLYFPCRPGETMYLTIDGNRKKYQIKNVDPVNLKDFTMGLTLREI